MTNYFVIIVLIIYVMAAQGQRFEEQTLRMEIIASLYILLSVDWYKTKRFV